MTTLRKKYSVKSKVKIALEAIKGTLCHFTCALSDGLTINVNRVDDLKYTTNCITPDLHED